MKFIKTIAIAFLLFNVTVSAQNFIGYNVDNYAGVHSLSINPANISGSPLRADINLISGSIFFANDYFEVAMMDILDAGGDFDFDNANRHPTNKNYFLTNVDVLGPSFMFNLSSKHSIGITTRVRGLANINNISGDLYESISDGFSPNTSFNADVTDFTSTVHVFGEIGLTYGRSLIDQQNNKLKMGVSLKYLKGAGGLFANSPNLTGNYTAANGSLATNGNLNYGFTEEFDADDVTFSNLTTGFGADFGLVYEYSPRMLNGAVQGRRQQTYKVKVGAAITDIGGITYENIEITNYNLNGTILVSEFDTKDIEQVLDDNYTGTTTTMSQKISLPTTLHLNVDYNVLKAFYVSAYGNFSMAADEYANGTLNTAVIAPRLETKVFALYAPISFRPNSDIACGFGFRLGPLTIGSGSVLTNFLGSSKSTDVYFALKIPLYKKVNFNNVP